MIAVDTVNTTSAPAKISLRIISTSTWPKILVFESQRNIQNPNLQAIIKQQNNYNLTILYPPSLLNEFSVKQADWSGQINPLDNGLNDNNNICDLYLLKTSNDLFGCKNIQKNEYLLDSLIIDFINSLENNNVSNEKQMEMFEYYPMLTMLLLRANTLSIRLKIKQMIILKRGKSFVSIIRLFDHSYDYLFLCLFVYSISRLFICFII